MVFIPADPNSAPLKRKDATFPPIPKRGRVKAQIFESLAKTIVHVASKAGGNLIGSSVDGEESGSSSPASPPNTPVISDHAN